MESNYAFTITIAMDYFAKLGFFKPKTEWMAIVAIIIIPPIIVSVLGCSFITNQTQMGPNIVSSKKKRLTSAALMYLGAKVIRTKGIATHMMHISGIIIESFPFKVKLSANKRAINVTINLPIIAEGTRLIFFADLIITAPTAKPVAQINPKKFPKTSPLSKESLKI